MGHFFSRPPTQSLRLDLLTVLNLVLLVELSNFVLNRGNWRVIHQARHQFHHFRISRHGLAEHTLVLFRDNTVFAYTNTYS